MRQDIINLYDAYTHGQLPRREFLERLGRLAGGAAAAAALMPLLVNDYAKAAVISPDDPRLTIFEATFETGDIRDPIRMPAAEGAGAARILEDTPLLTAYGAKPSDESILPAVIIIHENRGLNAHIKDIARRVALEGFQAFAIDALSPYGGTPVDEDAARRMIGALNREKTAAKIAKAVEKLSMVKTHQRRVGAIGFCWGGGMVNALAAAAPALTAGVVYYGPQAPAEAVSRIRAALLLHYAGLDERINAGMADYEAALRAAGVDVEQYVYDGVQHAFNNDANAARYDKAAADLAWSRTIAFLKARLAF